MTLVNFIIIISRFTAGLQDYVRVSRLLKRPLHVDLSCTTTPCNPTIFLSFSTFSNHVFLGLPRPLFPSTGKDIHFLSKSSSSFSHHMTISSQPTLPYTPSIASKPIPSNNLSFLNLSFHEIPHTRDLHGNED